MHTDKDAQRSEAVRRIRELETEITELAGHLNAANHRWLMLIAEFDDCQGWGDGGGTQSCAHWLNWKCGIAIGAAREKVRVAHALKTLPKISASMAKGELSYSKVRALTRVATPATEDDLLMVAIHGTAHHVEKLVRSYRRVLDAQELSREAQQQANRSVTYLWDDDGSLILRARLPAEAGALVLKALDIAMKSIEPKYISPTEAWLIKDMNAQEFAGTVIASQHPCSGIPASTSVYCRSPDRRHVKCLRKDIQAHPAGTPTVKLASTARADALALMSESFLQHGVEGMSGGDKHQVIVHVSAGTLQHNDAGACELEEGPAIAAETARRIACDCSVVRTTEDEDGNPLDIGRKTRSIPPALQRALKSRDRGCRFPGCCNTRYTHGHHIKHWANGGETSLKNLVTLCTFHHRLVHEGGVEIQILDDGALRFLKPNGTPYDQLVQIDTNWKQLKLQNIEHGLRIDAKTATARTPGDKLDYGAVVDVLLFREAEGEDGRSRGTLLGQ